MGYPYTSENRLLNPCTYMYTPFEGISFIKGYLNDRTVHIDRLHQAITDMKTQAVEPATDGVYLLIVNHLAPQLHAGFSARAINPGLAKLFDRKINPSEKQRLNRFITEYKWMTPLPDNVDTRINTYELLAGCLIDRAIDSNKEESIIELWMDRIVQRFEVTKKIYEYYLPGFKKGAGRNDNMVLYAMTALLLCCCQRTANGFKPLNTLLKINDTLCSLVPQIANDPIACLIACFTLISEHGYVLKLLQDRGILYESIR